MTTFSKAEIDRFRTDTPGTRKLIHLNNAGAALMPTPVKQAFDQYLVSEMEYGGYETAALQKTGLDAFYTEIAQLLNTHENQIAFAYNATDAYNKALSAIPFEKGDVILTSLNDYVSNQIAFLQLQKLKGITIVYAQDLPAGGLDTADMIRKMDQHRPKLVAVTHVPTNSGLIQHVATIGQACRERDILYLVDACQSVGQLVVDVQEIACDFLSATTRKFLRGPRGTGFLYLSEKILTRGYSPLFLDLHSAFWSAEDQFEIRQDAKRFELWEKPYAFMLGAAKAAAYANEIGMQRIEIRVKELAEYLRKGLSGISSIKVLDQGEEKAAIVTLYIPGHEPTALQEKLRLAGINSSHTTWEYNRFDMGAKKVPWILRLSPHYYNTLEELTTTLSTIEKIVVRQKSDF